jgi:hypothetical protein
MSDEEGFLARWSRRKRSAALKAREREERGRAATRTPAETPAAPAPPEPEPAPVDPAALPPIESIGAETDIRAFLAAGVPAELKRAALRKAWSADPAISGFVGLSENSWDFNAPDGVPGFGPLSAEDVRRLAQRLVGEGTDAEPAEPSPAERSAATESGGAAAEQRLRGDLDPSLGAIGAAPGDEPRATAPPVEIREGECCPIVPRRRGGALPK